MSSINPDANHGSGGSTHQHSRTNNDLHTLPTSPILLLPRSRPGRVFWSTPLDPHPNRTYGDAIRVKPKHCLRFFFQNVKGLSHSFDFEDYKYYLSNIKAYDIDIAGLAETNTAWQHIHLQQDIRKVFHREFRQSKMVFGAPTEQIDQCSPAEVFQSGGMITATFGAITSCIYREPIIDKTGLGRWVGVTIRGCGDFKLSVITAYRTCGGNLRTSSMGSVFSREFLYFRNKGLSHPNPRKLFLEHIGDIIRQLQTEGHCILLMLDANSDIATDQTFSEFVSYCDLHDLHRSHPPPSTYIGSAHRRIDYMLGCSNLLDFNTRSGALSYFEGPSSDHRGLYVDISIPALAPALRQQKLSPASQRSLHTGNPELVSAYLASIRKYYDEHRMVQRMDWLNENHTSMGKEEVLHFITKWDTDQGRAMAMAEQKLSRPPKKHPWSPTLRNHAVMRKYWKMRLRELRYGHCYAATFKRWEEEVQRYDVNFRFPNLQDHLTIEEVRRQFNLATKQFRKVQLNSTALRVQSYEDMIRHYSEDLDPHTQKESQRKSKVLLQTIRNETCRRLFSDLRYVIKQPMISSLSSLLVPNTHLRPGNISQNSSVYEILRDTKPEEILWETVIDRSDIEKHLLLYNREAFRAAAASPCGHGIIYDAITYSSLSSEAKELLRGTVPEAWHGDDAVIKEFLASFAVPQRVEAIAPISTTISEDDVTRGFKGWKETTTTSPSGRHLGHYRAFIQDPVLLKCLTLFLNIVLHHGISLPRWSQATNVLIEKDPGKPCINRLRIIHLFEADFNFLLKIIWGSRLVHRAVEYNLLHEGQYGSVPRRTTIDLIMLTQLTTDLSRILKMNLARFENDASACYDRIIVAFGMLAARRCGMPENAIATHSTALQFMKYAVKTVYGVSTDTYQGTELEPLFGTGQGSGASPAVWLSLVVLLLNTLDKLVPDRIQFESPNGCTIHRRLVDAFVDDTSLGLTDPDANYSFDEMIDRLQSVAQTWEKILSLSGGALNFKKCGWYAVYWEWDKGRPRLRAVRADDPTVQLHNAYLSASPPQIIPRMDTSNSSRVLGVQLSPSGSFSDAIKVYKRKADTFAARLLSPKIGVTEAFTFHRSIYIPTMRYGLAAISASEEELSGIQSNVLSSLLRKLHVHRHLPTSIRHGPTELGGLALYDMRTELGIENIKFLRNAIYSYSSAGQLILLNLQYLQLEAGIGECLLEKPHISIPYLTPSWLVSVRTFMGKHNISITLTDQPTVATAGPNDQFIMQSQHLQRYSPSQQKDINLVRIYLQVTTLADMTDDDRPTRVCPHYLDGRRPLDWKVLMKWPRQEVPSAYQRRLWRRYIMSSYLRYVPYWKQPPLSAAIYTLSVYKETVRQKPDHSRAASMHLQSYLKTLPRTQRRLVSDVTQVATDLQIWRAFRSKEKLYIASDGGLYGNQGTFGWVITSSKHVLFQCGGPVDGPYDTANSTRSELCGLSSSLLLVASLARNWGIRHRCSFRCILDSRSALSKVQKMLKRRPDSHQPPEADMLTMIRSLLFEIRRKVSFQWTKGHQDSLKAYDSLPRAARMNVDADFIATRYRLRGKLQSSRLIDHVSEQRVSISIMGVRLTSQYDSCIRYHINGYHLKSYMKDKRQWDEDTWNLVDFALFGWHARKQSQFQRVLHMKMVHGQLPLGTMRYHRSISKDEALKLCPCCKEVDEDKIHFYRCRSNSSSIPGLEKLRKDGSRLAHPLRRILSDGIKHWIDTGTSNFRVDTTIYPAHMEEAIRNIAREQERIGWDNAIHGLLSKAWIDLASLSYDRETRSLRDGEVRLRRCLEALYDFSVGLWKSRNSALHHSDDEKTQLLQSTTTEKITHLYQQSDRICFDDRYLCQIPLSKLLKGSPSLQRRWLQRMNDSREQYTRLGERQTLITSFFRRSNP